MKTTGIPTRDLMFNSSSKDGIRLMKISRRVLMSSLANQWNAPVGGPKYKEDWLASDTEPSPLEQAVGYLKGFRSPAGPLKVLKSTDKSILLVPRNVVVEDIDDYSWGSSYSVPLGKAVAKRLGALKTYLMVDVLPSGIVKVYYRGGRYAAWTGQDGTQLPSMSHGVQDSVGGHPAKPQQGVEVDPEVYGDTKKIPLDKDNKVESV